VTATPAAAGLLPVTFTAFAAAPPTTADVTVRDNSFDPRSVVIKVGGTVTWTWVGTVATHNVTLSGPAPRPADLTNRSSGSGQGTFNTVGQYPYLCTNHAGMSGTVTVVN
jgi:plastocyanin